VICVPLDGWAHAIRPFLSRTLAEMGLGRVGAYDCAMGIALAAAVVFMCATFVATSKHAANLLPFLIGLSAGLVDVRIGRLHILTALVVVWAVMQLVNKRKHSFTPLFVIGAVTLVAASSVLLGPLVNSNTLAIQLLALSVSAGLLAGFSSSQEFRTMMWGLLATCSAASFVGLLQVVGVIDVALFHMDVSGLGRPMAFYREPDWLGLFSAIGLVLAWRLIDDKTWRNALVLLNGAVFVFAFARAAWVAVLGSILIYAVVRALQGRFQSEARKPVVGLAILIVIVGSVSLASLPQLRDDLGRRIGQTVQAQDSDISGQARIQQNQGLLYLAKTAPWHGQGVSASGRVGVSMWVDSALLGIPLILMLISVAIRAATTIPGQLLAVALLNSLFSNATYVPIVWFLLGMSVAAVSRGTDGSEPISIRRRPNEFRTSSKLATTQ
jgi:hypothetical protein